MENLNTRISFKIQGQKHGTIESSEPLGGVDKFYELLENVQTNYIEGDGKHINVGTTFECKGDKYKVVDVSIYYYVYKIEGPSLDIRYIVVKL